ncbi:hypothetical protein QBC33DRAFT_554898 [Phialemonium atrogriseum]|uniref:Nuclear membrane fusion protein Kar5 n=1 Tax=Phialemonium atrogriseum TaxID=1093897 RepID=A0AAJ0FKL4_9PEZI|nr:uncharacterized protein QBC33DRAFT_554898 [Phialemonium atrogriseum]KAK1771731.1 hypothetical protein QBC33DRAFT_554898 [Phialemonium atrogriseum]
MAQHLSQGMVRGLALAFGILLLFASPTAAFWASEKKASPVGRRSEILNSNSPLPSIYAIALSELQELESEPLCHRVAARLLVSNCQLLDGKDEATVLTDSGRQLRDFIDSYAASLAICDLERGRFSIPSECAKFRESSLSLLSPNYEPTLHVSSKEIDLCLSALGTSDSAWNTWVSYRHKALRFCEAARADNEKARSVQLYQRLTRVIAKLAEGVEAELQKRMADLDNRARRASESMDQLNPQIDQLREGLAKVEEYLSRDMRQAVKESSEAIKDGLGQAEDLHQALAIMLKTILEGNSQVAVAHEQSLELATNRANDEMGGLMAVIAGAVASSATLQNQIEISRLQAAELETRQGAVEEGLNRLIEASEALSTKYNHHSYLLRQAGNITEDILDSLVEAASTASSVNQSLFKASISTSWWPYIVCPTVALVMGSYGLPPSAFRNLGLIAFGELVGFLVSSFDHIQAEFFSFAGAQATGNSTFTGL